MRDKKLDSRVNRLVGQIEGMRRMMHSGRKTEDVVQQILAARQALSRIGIVLLKEELAKSAGKDQKKIERLLEKIFRT